LANCSAAVTEMRRGQAMVTKSPKTCNDIKNNYKKNDQAANFDLCKCQVLKRNVQITDTTAQACAPGMNTSTENGIPVCEEWSRRKLCKLIRVQACEGAKTRVNGRCPGKCPTGWVERGGNCFEPTGCKSDETELSGGCVKKCKSGKELKDGKCVKPDPSCRTKRQCQKYWVKTIRALKQKTNVAKKALSAAKKLKNRRLQAMVPKASVQDLKNKLASLKVEINNAREARK
jgi:hypothetical protein